MSMEATKMNSNLNSATELINMMHANRGLRNPSDRAQTV